MPLPLVHSGKVRDVYDAGDDRLLLVATDRVSVYDVVLPDPIPDKGKMLTQLSLWWFDQLADVAPNHVLPHQEEVPPEFTGRAVLVRRLEMVTVECIARGYLAGLGLEQYRADGAISGVPLPAGLREGDRLPEPIFTPTTKATEGHDEPMTYDQVVDVVGADIAGELRRITLETYRRGTAAAADRGVIIADTKLELGWDSTGTLTIGDELLTSDSSRFWPADDWIPGRPQHAMDKQFVRDWAAGTGWDKKPPAPAVPADVVAATRDRYIDVYERLTGQTWK